MTRTATTQGMNPLPSIIRASAWDAGDRSMRAAGRTKWSRKDYAAAGDEQARLIRTLFSRPDDTDPREAFCRFGYAEAMQREGLLTLATKDFHGALDESYRAYVASLSQEAA